MGNLARASALEGEFAELQARQSRKFSVGFLLPNVVYVATYSVLYPSFNKLPVAGAGVIIVAHVCVLLRFAYPRGAWLPSPPTGHALLLVAISMVIAFTHPEVQYHFAPTFQIYEALGKRPVCAETIWRAPTSRLAWPPTAWQPRPAMCAWPRWWPQSLCSTGSTSRAPPTHSTWTAPTAGPT